MGYSMDSSDSLVVMGASLIALTPTPVDDGLVKKGLQSLRLGCYQCWESKG